MRKFQPTALPVEHPVRWRWTRWNDAHGMHHWRHSISRTFPTEFQLPANFNKKSISSLSPRILSHCTIYKLIYLLHVFLIFLHFSFFSHFYVVYFIFSPYLLFASVFLVFSLPSVSFFIYYLTYLYAPLFRSFVPFWFSHLYFEQCIRKFISSLISFFLSSSFCQTVFSVCRLPLSDNWGLRLFDCNLAILYIHRFPEILFMITRWTSSNQLRTFSYKHLFSFHSWTFFHYARHCKTPEFVMDTLKNSIRTLIIYPPPPSSPYL